MITSKCSMAPTIAPLLLPGFVTGQGTPLLHHPTSCPSALSVMAASPGEGSRLTTTLVPPTTAPVSPQAHQGWGTLESPLLLNHSVVVGQEPGAALVGHQGLIWC